MTPEQDARRRAADLDRESGVAHRAKLVRVSDDEWWGVQIRTGRWWGWPRWLTVEVIPSDDPTNYYRAFREQL